VLSPEIYFLLVAECDERIDASGAAGWDYARGYGGGRQH